MSRDATPPLFVVMGVSGCGKSTVGAALARGLGTAFCDADDLHTPENVAKMAAGQPLDDHDRLPWLEAVGRWLADHAESGGVMSCSALKRAYRDLLRTHAPDVAFIHLHTGRELIARRQADRPDHFMPSSLLESQLETIEPLDADERGETVDAALSVEELVGPYVDG